MGLYFYITIRTKMLLRLNNTYDCRNAATLNVDLINWYLISLLVLQMLFVI